jgi:hypothetical protein
MDRTQIIFFFLISKSKIARKSLVTISQCMLLILSVICIYSHSISGNKHLTKKSKQVRPLNI